MIGADIDRLKVRSRPVGPPVMYQRWSDLTFLHWEVDQSEIEKLIPPELTVDTFDGKTYVGLVPFTMSGIRLRGLPMVPGFNAFHETNVRVYVLDSSGTPGVYFLSLEAANLVAVKIARFWFGLPYFWSTMHLSFLDDSIQYLSQRKGTKINSDLESKVFEEPYLAEVGSLEFWFVERYALFSKKGNRLFVGRVFHDPYRISRAQVLSIQDELVHSSGISVSGTPDFAHFSPGVDVEVFGLKSVEKEIPF